MIECLTLVIMTAIGCGTWVMVVRSNNRRLVATNENFLAAQVRLRELDDAREQRLLSDGGDRCSG